jgi:hypothetical protein
MLCTAEISDHRSNSDYIFVLQRGIRIHKSKTDKTMAKRKRTNNDLHNIDIKLKIK